MPKGKRSTPETKLADLIKKKVRYRSELSNCSNCKFSVVRDAVEEIRGEEVIAGTVTCTKHEQLVTFEVGFETTCDEWAKKRKPRVKKEKKEKKAEKTASSKKEKPSNPKTSSLDKKIAKELKKSEEKK